MNARWLSAWLITISSMRPWPPVRFENGSVVSATEWVRVLPGIGATLHVPPSLGAVLTFRSGRRKVFTEGVHWLGGSSFPAGLYPVRYVDLKIQRTTISLTEAFCRDGWRGGLAVEIRWRIGDVMLSVDIPDLIGNLVSAARAIVTGVIEITWHDQLTGGMGEVIQADNLANQVNDELNACVPHIRVLKVLITDRRGDERRIRIVQETTLERARVLQEQELKRQKLSSQAELISGQTHVERVRQEFALLEAKGKRRQVEEEHRARIRESEIEAEVSKNLSPARWQQARLDVAPTINQQRYEQVNKLIDKYAEVFCGLVQWAELDNRGTGQRRRPEFDLDGLGSIFVRGMGNLQDLVQPLTPLASPEPLHATNGRHMPVSDIANAAEEVNSLPGVQGVDLKMPNGKEEYRVVVHFKDRDLILICPPDYPYVPPEVSWAADPGRRLPFEWTEGMSLKKIVQNVLRKSAGSKRQTA